MQVIKEVWDQSELVNTELTQFDQSTHISTAFAEEHEAHCWRMGSDADPAQWLTTVVAPPSEAIATEFGYGPETVSSLNYPNWFDQEAYEAALAAQATDDFDTRYGLYESIFLKMAEDVPFWYSGHTAYLAATADNVFGVNGWTTPDGVLGSGISPEVEVRWHEVFIES
jgi:ABC-type transport system substrate-binding protein